MSSVGSDLHEAQPRPEGVHRVRLEVHREQPFRLERPDDAREPDRVGDIVNRLAEGGHEGSSFTAEVRRMPPAVDTESRLEKSLLGHVGRAIADFGLVAEGDRIMVGVSGGKDSHTLLEAAARPAAAFSGALRAARGHPRPGAPRLPRSTAGRALCAGRGAVPTPPRGHLLHRPGEDAAGEDDVHRLLATAAGHPLQRGGGARLQQDRPRPPPRRRGRDVAPQPLLRRDAARGCRPSSARTTGGTSSSGR